MNLLIYRSKYYDVVSLVNLIIWSSVLLTLIGAFTSLIIFMDFEISKEALATALNSYPSRVLDFVPILLFFQVVMGIISMVTLVCTAGDIISVKEYKKRFSGSYKPLAYKV